MSNSRFNDLNKSAFSASGQLQQALVEAGINFATGVPCGVLRSIIDFLVCDEHIQHVTVSRESEAIGVATGAYLAGRRPIIYMQNSGLFAASNDISSLLMPYRVPLLMVVTLRGSEGEDAPQHLVNGRATTPLLASFGIPYTVYDAELDIHTVVLDLFEQAADVQLPAILLLKRGWDKT